MRWPVVKGEKEIYDSQVCEGFPKIRGTILGVHIIRTIVFWGLYWGPPILGKYHVAFGAVWAAGSCSYCSGNLIMSKKIGGSGQIQE